MTRILFSFQSSTNLVWEKKYIKCLKSDSLLGKLEMGLELQFSYDAGGSDEMSLAYSPQ